MYLSQKPVKKTDIFRGYRFAPRIYYFLKHPAKKLDVLDSINLLRVRFVNHKNIINDYLYASLYKSYHFWKVT